MKVAPADVANLREGVLFSTVTGHFPPFSPVNGSVHKLNPSYLATVNKHAKNSYRSERQERDSDLDDVSRKEKAVRIIADKTTSVLKIKISKLETRKKKRCEF